MSQWISEPLRLAMMDAFSKLLEDEQTVWISWVINTKVPEYTTTGHLWWKRTHTNYWWREVHYPRKPIKYGYKDTGQLVLRVAGDSFICEHDGTILGIDIYPNEHTKEPLLRASFNGNTNKVTKGSTIMLVHDSEVDFK